MAFQVGFDLQQVVLGNSVAEIPVPVSMKGRVAQPQAVQIQQVQQAPNLSQFVSETLLYWKARMLEVRWKIRKVKDYSEVERCLQNRHGSVGPLTLFPDPPDLPDDELKLGDRVRIALQKRQLKQAMNGNWNELITKSFGDIGRVVGRFKDGKNETIVSFSRSASRFLMARNTLEKVDDFSSDDAAQVKFNVSNNGLQIGSEVTIVIETSLVTFMQRNHGIVSEQLLPLQNHLGRIVAFNSNGDAYVTVSDYSCVIVNPALLSERNFPVPLVEQKPLPDFKPGTKVIVNQDLEVVMKSISAMFRSWNYEMTQIIGKQGTVTYSLQSGEIGVKVKDRVWRLNTKCVKEVKDKKKSKTRKGRHKSGGEQFKTSATFPFSIGTVVRPINYIDLQRLLKNQGVLKKFLEVLLQSGTVIGYSSTQTTVVQFGKRIQHIGTCFLQKSEERMMEMYHRFEDVMKNVKENDKVMLDTSAVPCLIETIDGLKTDDSVKQAMFGVGTLLAISDERDEAYIKYINEDVFAIPTEYVTGLTGPFEAIVKGLETVQQTLPRLKRQLGAVQDNLKSCVKKLSLPVDPEEQDFVNLRKLINGLKTYFKQYSTVRTESNRVFVENVSRMPDSNHILVTYKMNIDLQQHKEEDMECELLEFLRSRCEDVVSVKAIDTNKIRIVLVSHVNVPHKNNEPANSNIEAGEEQGSLLDEKQQDNETVELSELAELEHVDAISEATTDIASCPDELLDHEEDHESDVEDSAVEQPVSEAENDSRVGDLQVDDTDIASEAGQTEIQDEEYADDSAVTVPKQHELPSTNQLQNPSAPVPNSREVIKQTVPFYRDTKEIVLKCSLQPNEAENQQIPEATDFNMLPQNRNLNDQLPASTSVQNYNTYNITNCTMNECPIGGDVVRLNQ